MDGDSQRPRQVTPSAVSMEQRQVVPNALLGTMIFVLTEIMFFAGMISAFLISKASTPGGIWPPPGQPRLPVEATAFNTVALLLSGAAMVVAHQQFKKSPSKATVPFLVAAALGVFFVGFQGFEWAGLLNHGLSMSSGPYGAFFFLIVGSHALHAVIGLAILAKVFVLLRQGALSLGGMQGMTLYWLFVVLLWPVLYWQVYL